MMSSSSQIKTLALAGSSGVYLRQRASLPDYLTKSYNPGSGCQMSHFYSGGNQGSERFNRLSKLCRGRVSCRVTQQPLVLVTESQSQGVYKIAFFLPVVLVVCWNNQIERKTSLFRFPLKNDLVWKKNYKEKTFDVPTLYFSCWT